jgi:hypothetical protein
MVVVEGKAAKGAVGTGPVAGSGARTPVTGRAMTLTVTRGARRPASRLHDVRPGGGSSFLHQNLRTGARTRQVPHADGRE